MVRKNLATFFLILTPVVTSGAASPTDLDSARRLWQNGRYAEAQEGYDALLKEPETHKLDPTARARALLGRVDCLVSQGELDKAQADLEQALKDLPGEAQADLSGRLAELKFRRGDWEGADASVVATLKLNPDHLAARWVAARLLEAQGRQDEAVDAGKWFID